ncbi:DUF6779 domain-containing protein [Mycobacteroides chelonae]|uniref:DUF6779 domain-containing protein n=1 Tax=Mycobacteroides chelonae TaxID=1774 RepID=UPI001F4445D1|nr:DUF6779 domain-containing protein [Mycobacteroides chelonae]
MTIPTRAAKPRRGSRRPGWALLTALLVLAIGSGIALVFTDKAIYLRVGLLLALWAAVIASFAALTYRRQSDTDQAKVRDQKLVYDLQLEREISARREYELTVESRLRQQLAGEIEAQAADEIATLRAELAALRTNLEILFNTELSERPAIEHDPIRALGPWPGAEPEPAPNVGAPAAAFTHSVREPQPAPTAEYQDVTAVEEDNRTSEYPIIDVAEDPHHVDEAEAPPTPPYPAPPYYGAAQPHEPEPYQQPVSSGTHWRPQPEPHAAQSPVPPQEPAVPVAPPAGEPVQQAYWAARQEDWDAAADGEDWDPTPQPIAPPEQAVSQPVWNEPPRVERPAPAASERVVSSPRGRPLVASRHHRKQLGLQRTRAGSKSVSSRTSRRASFWNVVTAPGPGRARECRWWALGARAVLPAATSGSGTTELPGELRGAPGARA